MDREEGKSEEKLYAGKFKTIEDLEAGYKSSLPTFQENETLKKKVEELSSIPTTYLLPTDLEVDAGRLADIQERAKEASMTQAQYEKFVRNDKKRLDQHKQHFETAKKEVGEETINILSDYVSKNYPKELQDNLLNTFIGNKEARQAALNHRQQLLSNQMPGMQKTTPPNSFHVTDEDIKKAYKNKEENKSDMRARQHYMNLLSAKAQQESAR